MTKRTILILTITILAFIVIGTGIGYYFMSSETSSNQIMKGTIIDSYDLSFVDAGAGVTILTSDNKKIELGLGGGEIPSAPCNGTIDFTMKKGDHVEIVGKINNNRYLDVCSEKSFYIKVIPAQ